MNRRKIALGPGAASIILIVVVLALCMLSMLTLVTAKNDLNLSERSAEMIESVYALNASAERRLAALDTLLVQTMKTHPGREACLSALAEQLPEGMALEGDTVSWTEPLDNRWLECRVRLLPENGTRRTEWTGHRLIVEEPEDDWEWD